MNIFFILQHKNVSHEAEPQNVNLQNEIKNILDTGKVCNIYKRRNSEPIIELLSFTSCSNGPHLI